MAGARRCLPPQRRSAAGTRARRLSAILSSQDIGRLRRAVLRLANGVEKASADAILSVAARRVARAGFRLHPFDLPRLIGHIKGDARCLGLAERAYLALAESSNAADTPGLLQAEITSEN